MGDIIQHEQLQCCRKSVKKTKGYKDKTGETDATVRKRGTDGREDLGRLDRDDINQDQERGTTLPIAKVEINVTDSLERLLLKIHLQSERCTTKRKGCKIVNCYKNIQSKTILCRR